MSDADFLAWLQSPSAIRLVIVEAEAQIEGVDTTIYLSTNGGYVTGAADTPANTIYHGIASIGVLFTEQLSLTGDASMSAGDIEIHNFNGERDDWYDYIWTNRPVLAWVGDPRWARADFRMIFNGVAADVAPKGREKIGLMLRDKMQRLNTPVTEDKLGGSTPNQDSVLPLLFGEGHNISPLLIDPAALSYQVHDGALESIFEVRDNGLPVSVTAHVSTGTFELAASPAGAINVSAQGDKPSTYINTISKLIQRLVTGYGKASDRFVSGDLDATNLGAFESAHTQPVGMYLPDRTNVLTACQMLASSIGAQISMSRIGTLRLFQIALPAAGASTDIRPKHMVEKSLVPMSRTEVVAAVKLGYNKNWTVQPGLQTWIPAQDKDLFAEEWLTTTAIDAGVQADYLLDVDPVQQDTMLLRLTDADTEATRQLDLWKVPRTIYQFEGTPEMLLLELGQPVTVYNARFGMSDGVAAMVISLAPNWLNGHVTVGFIV